MDNKIEEIVKECYRGRQWNPGEGRRKAVEFPRGNILDINVDTEPGSDHGFNITIASRNITLLEQIIALLEGN